MSQQHILLTGAAGFIGSAVAHALLDRGVTVSGVDSLTSYYSTELKRARLARLDHRHGSRFHHADIADHQTFLALADEAKPDIVIHLAAQAGVRYSLDNPFAYAHANLNGHLSVLETVRHLPNKPFL